MDRKTAAERALAYFELAHIVITPEEAERIEVADFGLDDLEHIGLELLTYVNTDRCCAKEMVLFPGQTCPEHLHPSKGPAPGKEETFRVRFGKVHLYVEGDNNCGGPDHPEGAYTVFHEIILMEGMQHTIYPDTKHWFRAGEDGAVISEFSTHSDDASDIFSDGRIIR